METLRNLSLPQLLKAFGSGMAGGALGWPMDTAVSLANLARAGYGYAGNKMGLLSAAEMPGLVEGSNIPGTSAHLSGLLGVGGSMPEQVAEFAGGLLSPGPKVRKAPRAELTAYHGSPHSFDKFDMSKIGTGEGGQAYGPGLYFAENRSVADGYKRALGGHEFDVGGKKIYGGTSTQALDKQSRAELLAAESLTDAFAAQSSSPAQFAAWRLRSARQAYPEDGKNIDEALEVIGKWQESGGHHRISGNLYKVDIPDEHIGKMLDWDKPLSQQPESVQAGLRKAFKRIYGERGPVNYEAASGMTGGDVVERLSGRGPKSGEMSQRTSAEFLKAGIPGIRYLDGGSRGKGGTSNFVLFDDQIPKILSRE